MLRKICLHNYLENQSVDCFLVNDCVNNLSYYQLKNNYGLEWIHTFFDNNYKIEEYARKDNKRIFLASLI